MLRCLFVLVPMLANAFVLQPSNNIEDEVAALVAKLNLTEKISLMGGIGGIYTGNVPELSNFNIPALKMEDGPQGFRTTPDTGGDGSSTAWPSAMSIAASWDTNLLNRWAVAMAEEFKGKGANMALGPGIGIARVPTAGRNFEYLCGEDPVLGAKLVGPVVKGFQDNGIIANAKHFVNNEIETDRTEVGANVDERTRFELYYPPFAAAADAGVLSVMCSYNRINDVYACENPDTIAHLRSNLGFRGFIVSDWGAVHSTVPSLTAGLDMEMPFSDFYSQTNIQKALAKGQITTNDIDRSAYHILYAMKAIGLLDNPVATGDAMANVTSDAHNALAREIASSSTVLLKNTAGILPLKAESLGSCIAVIGDQTTVCGCGSGQVVPPYIITTTQGLQNALTDYGITTTSVLYNDGSDLNSAATLAAQCPVAIVMGATYSCEGGDRENLSLGNNQDTLISTIAAANKNTIVALDVPGAILMPWEAQVSSILVSWMPGQEAGNALADILFGKVNPSARLPVTMPNKDNEIAFTAEQYPGTVVDGEPFPQAVYSESLLIGYRWYDANQVTPKFAFGHGLSYTTFSYSSLSIKMLQSSPKVASNKTPIVMINFQVKNEGKIGGAEVAQVYLQYPAAAGEPPKQLKAFQKVGIGAGNSMMVTITLTKQDCSIWDTTSHDWMVVSGEYTVFVGASSRDIRLQDTFQL